MGDFFDFDRSKSERSSPFKSFSSAESLKLSLLTFFFYILSGELFGSIWFLEEILFNVRDAEVGLNNSYSNKSSSTSSIKLA